MKRLLYAVLLISVAISFSFAGVGDPAPEFELESLSGETIKLSDYSGKIVYIFFFGYS